jgi:hypothetical protein
MLVTSPIDHASWWLSASNVVYVSGAVLTLAAAVHVLLEKRAVLTGKREKESFWAEASVFLAALVSVLGTIGAIHYSNTVSHLKDVALEQYKQQAGIQIAQAQADAAKAKSDAADANKNAADADSHLAGANQQAAEANKKAAEANVTAQQAVLDKTKILNDNLQLQQQMAQEQNARQQIQQQIAARDLGAQSQQAIISQLRLSAHQDIDFIVYPGNTESDHLMRQIAYPFQQMGWDFHVAQPMGGSLQGIRIECDGQDSEVRKAANIIAAALRSSGLQIDTSSTLPALQQELGAFTSDGKAGSGKIRIFVGSK